MALDINEIGKQQVQLWDGSHALLNTFWAQGPLVLVFLRHYG
jgi:hypothetical protein